MNDHKHQWLPYEIENTGGGWRYKGDGSAPIWDYSGQRVITISCPECGAVKEARSNQDASKLADNTDAKPFGGNDVS